MDRVTPMQMSVDVSEVLLVDRVMNAAHILVSWSLGANLATIGMKEVRTAPKKCNRSRALLPHGREPDSAKANIEWELTPELTN